jgi:hypothetical protein
MRMRKLQAKETENALLITCQQACDRYNLGLTSVRQLMKDSGAMVKIGKSVRINMPVMDAYILKEFSVTEDTDNE